MRWVRHTVAVPLLTAAVLVAGCGGTSGPSKAEYIADADAICQSARSEAAPLVASLAPLAGGSVTPAGVLKATEALKDLQAIGTAYVSKLRALDRPEGDDTAITAFLTPTGKVVDAVSDASDALTSGRPLQALSVFQQAQPMDASAQAAAKAYGFKQCGSVVAPGAA